VKSYSLFFSLMIFATPLIANANNMTTSAMVNGSGDVVISTPNGTGSTSPKPNFPANDNNGTYVVTPGDNTSSFDGQHYAQYNHLTDEQRDEIEQRRYEQAYDRAQSQQANQ
jgi:hypothetical protein